MDYTLYAPLINYVFICTILLFVLYDKLIACNAKNKIIENNLQLTIHCEFMNKQLAIFLLLFGIFEYYLCINNYNTIAWTVLLPIYSTIIVLILEIKRK
jgi:hypothetical protein